MEKVLTNDGSTTFYSSQYGECYHSRSGAEDEAVRKFIEPCRINELALQGEVDILDIGFGLGYNVAAAIDCVNSVNKNCKLNILSLEKDTRVFCLINDLDSRFECYWLIKELVNTGIKDSKIEFDKGNISIKIFIGNAVENIKTIINKFDAVFLDPFSPKKNPELWMTDFFKEMRKVVKDDAVIATYSCAKVARSNLKEAGFKVIDGPVVGRRSPGTLAFPE